MNVALEDPFMVIGCTGKQPYKDNPTLKVPIPMSLQRVLPIGEIPNESIEMRQEIYQIDWARSYSKGKIRREGRLIKIKQFQDISPLKVKPYCELDWNKQ